MFIVVSKESTASIFRTVVVEAAHSFKTYVKFEYTTPHLKKCINLHRHFPENIKRNTSTQDWNIVLFYPPHTPSFGGTVHFFVLEVCGVTL
jgi:hypothetical protein